jgi:hypothetical protein
MRSFRKHTLTALALCLAAALPAFAEPLRTVEAPAGTLEKYLPDGSDGVIVINIRQLLDSELVKKAGLDNALAGDGPQKAIKVIGFDPLKDVERLIVTSDKSEKEEQPCFIFQGKFDPDKLHAAIAKAAEEKKDVVKIHKTDNGKLYELTKLDEIAKLPPQLAGAGVNLKGKSLFLVFADKGNVVLTGSKEGAETALAKAAGKKATKLTNKDLVTLLAKINPKQSIAVALPAPPSEQNFRSITGGVTVTSDMKVDFTVTAADADSARKIDGLFADQLKQLQDILASLVVLEPKAVGPAVDILNGIKHDTKDNAMTVKSDIKGETLEKLVKGLAELAARQAGGGGIK